MKRRNIGIAAMLIVVLGNVANAGTIEYAWEGWLTQLDVNVDPWELGALGKPYAIAGSVDDNAADLNETVATAIFELNDITLVIDGMSPSFLGSGRVFLGDREIRDLVTIDLDDIEVNGVREPLFTVAQLPPSTFAFESIDESPPTFPATITIFGGGAVGDGSSYSARTEAGVIVTGMIIPEPTSLLLALLASLGAGITLRRNRSR